MDNSRNGASPGLDAFLAEILGDYAPAGGAAALAAAILDEETLNESGDERGGRTAGGSYDEWLRAIVYDVPEPSAAFAAAILREYDPNEPRDWHGRWTTGGSDDSPTNATALRGSWVLPPDESAFPLNPHVIPDFQKSEPGVQVAQGAGGFTVDDLLRMVRLSPKIQALFDEATKALGKEGKVRIRLMAGLGHGASEPTHDVNMVNGHRVESAAGDIFIDPDDSVDQALETFVFELGNLKRRDASKDLENRAAAGQVGKQDYIEGKLVPEYDNLNDTINLMKSLGKEPYHTAPKDLAPACRSGNLSQFVRDDIRNAESDILTNDGDASAWSQAVHQNAERYRKKWDEKYAGVYDKAHGYVPVPPIPPVRPR